MKPKEMFFFSFFFSIFENKEADQQVVVLYAASLVFVSQRFPFLEGNGYWVVKKKASPYVNISKYSKLMCNFGNIFILISLNN